MNDTDYVTRAELRAILEDYSERSAAHLSDALTRSLTDLAAQLAPLATVDDLGRRFDAGMAEVVAHGATACPRAMPPSKTAPSAQKARTRLDVFIVDFPVEGCGEGPTLH